MGNVIAVTDPRGYTTNTSYDPLGRLASSKTNPQVAASAASRAADIVVSNTYDKANNLVQVSAAWGSSPRST